MKNVPPTELTKWMTQNRSCSVPNTWRRVSNPKSALWKVWVTITQNITAMQCWVMTRLNFDMMMNAEISVRPSVRSSVTALWSWTLHQDVSNASSTFRPKLRKKVIFKTGFHLHRLRWSHGKKSTAGVHKIRVPGSPCDISYGGSWSLWSPEGKLLHGPPPVWHPDGSQCLESLCIPGLLNSRDDGDRCSPRSTYYCILLYPSKADAFQPAQNACW